jgi:DNA repair protein RadC
VQTYRSVSPAQLDLQIVWCNVVGDDAREHFLAIYLDSRHRPIAYQVVSIDRTEITSANVRDDRTAAARGSRVADGSS